VPYLQDLTIRLAMGAADYPDPIRRRHTRWLLDQQRADGGFAGREGESDPYYTGFALRCLMILGVLDGEPAERAAGFLRSRLDQRESIIDLISLVFGSAVLEMAAGIDVLRDAQSQWRQAVAALLESLRREDGGYAKSPEGRAGSTYQSFLTVLCYELLEQEVPEADRLYGFLQRHEHPEGGFLEIRVGKRAGVNPTAAAIGTLKVLDRLDAETAARTADFLADMQSEEGGFTANGRIPMADLLSTCTGLITLHDLQATSLVDLPPLRQYALSMQRDAGGFAGFAMDPAKDVEYTFYGLATLALTPALPSDLPSDSPTTETR